MTSQEFKTLQQSDPTLQTVLQAAKGHPSKAGVGFVEKDGLIYRRWKPPRQGPDGAIEQLVLPQECRKEILELSHDVPFAGHLGKDSSEILLAYSL